MKKMRKLSRLHIFPREHIYRNLHCFLSVDLSVLIKSSSVEISGALGFQGRSEKVTLDFLQKGIGRRIQVLLVVMDTKAIYEFYIKVLHSEKEMKYLLMN